MPAPWEAGPQAHAATVATAIRIRIFSSVPRENLERKVFAGSLLVHAGLRQIAAGIHWRGAQTLLVVLVWSCYPAGAPHGPHFLAPPHFLPGLGIEPREVRVVGLDAAAVIDHYQPAIAIAPLGVDHDAIRRGHHGRAGGGADIHSLMKFSALFRERVGALAERSHQSAVHRPQTGLRHYPQTARGAVLQRQRIGAAEEGVVLHAFCKSRDQFAFGRNVGWP